MRHDKKPATLPKQFIENSLSHRGSYRFCSNFNSLLGIVPTMGNKVLASVENSYGDYCVDVFVRPNGTFGFEEYRRDPEDGGGWYPLQRYSGQVFNSEGDALAQAKKCVAWLKANET